MDSFETRYTYSLGQSSHLILFKLFVFFVNFHPIFIQIATAPTIFLKWIPLKLGTEIR